MKWAYGLTTVPGRRDELLPRTLASLRAGGFDKPRLFIDGAKDDRDYQQFGLETVCRYPTIRTVGNWILSLIELYIREPYAERYAIFQDDIIVYPNLKSYLEVSPYPNKAYLNLYTTVSNEKIIPAKTGWHPSNQLGRGALALVFSNEALVTLFSNQHMVMKPKCMLRGWKSIDGAVSESMKIAKWFEYVHYPTLVQHTGLVSSMGNVKRPLAPSWRGEDYDALTLVGT